MKQQDDPNLTNPLLNQLRAKLRQTDERFLRLVAERVRIAQSIGKLKSALNLPMRVPEIEAATIEHAAVFARELNIDESLFVELQQLLIKHALAEHSKIVKSQ